MIAYSGSQTHRTASRIPPTGANPIPCVLQCDSNMLVPGYIIILCWRPENSNEKASALESLLDICGLGIAQGINQLISKFVNRRVSRRVRKLDDF